MDEDARTRFVYYFSNKSWPLEKAKSRQQTNNDQHKQGAQRQHREGCTQHSTLYSCQESHSQHIFRRHPSDAAYSQCCGEPERSSDSCSEEKTQKRANCKQSIRWTKQIEERFRLFKERRPRDASPVSVVFGVDRDQVLVSRFEQLPFVATSTACCCCARYDMREVR